MKNHYFNTVNLNGTELERRIDKAKTQEEIILSFFELHPNEFFTPLAIHKRLFTPETPCTSIRRAMSVLTKDGKLYKSSVKEIEMYGEPNYCWSLVITDPSGQTKIC